MAELIRDNLLNPPILFFFLGMIAIFLRSDLEIPSPIPKILSLYLLLSIGFKGGLALQESGFTAGVIVALVLAVLMACLVPLWSYAVLRLRLDTYNAAAIAATYGSVSAVTFITAFSYLEKVGIPFSGHMVAAMALMESPAIVLGVVLVRLTAGQDRNNGNGGESWGQLLRESFFNGPVMLLMGSLVIGLLTPPAGATSMAPLTVGLFHGILAFFLLDMGLLAARQLGALRRGGLFLGGFAVLMPVLNASIGLLLAYVANMGVGDALLFTILCASASYIAVPAAVRIAIPEANPSLYVPMALAITFPFNIVVGIPLYLAVINWMWGAG